MVGTYLAGWPTDRFGARRVLVAATLLRGVVLAGIPVAMALGVLHLTFAMVCYTVEALIRGYVDTSVHTVPLELAGHRADLWIASTLGMSWHSRWVVAGPLMLSGLMIWSDGIVPHIVIPVGFVVSAGCYLFVPERSVGGDGAHNPRTADVGGFEVPRHAPVFAGHRRGPDAVPPLRAAQGPQRVLCHRGCCTNRPRPVTSGPPSRSAGWSGVALRGEQASGPGAGWVLGGVAGTVFLALGWIPVNLPTMIVAVFLFGVTNVGARLVLTRWRQELTP